MTSYFFDTSALFKRYVVETGTTWVQSTLNPQNGHKILIGQITVVEIVSAISRLKRDKVVSARTAQAVRIMMNRHMRREYDVVLLKNSILQTAQDVLDKYPLRAFDAIQLASALDSNARLTSAGLAALIFVSGDVRLLNAATGEGLQTHHPT